MSGLSGSGWLTALRVARREARRAKGRSALVVALIGLPVFALAFAAVSYDSFRLTTEQELDRELGAADAEVQWPYRGPLQQDPTGRGYIGDERRTEPATEAELLGALPPGSRATPVVERYVDLRTAAGVGSLRAHGLDLTDPLVEGLARVVSGRAATADDEVAVTHQAADRLGATIGDTVTTADESRSYTVVGIVEFPATLRELVVFRPDALPTAEPVRGFASWLVATPEPVTWGQVRELNRDGLLVRSRAVQLDPPPESELYPELGVQEPGGDGRELAAGALITGLALLEVVLLAGPAFAVGARRRRRDLALVAATGGTPGHQRRIVLADGVVLGAAGAVVGIVLGVVAALAAQPLLEEYVWQARAGGYRFFPLALLGVAGLAVLTGLAAALVPAAVAARQHVVDALAGRRGVTRSGKRWLLLGLVLAATGAAVAAWGAWRVSTTLVLAGLIIGELGLVLCTPTLVGLIARGGRLTPLPVRIALRDTARNRAAAAPAISAVMAAVAGSLALGIFLSSDQARQDASYQEALPLGSAAVQYEWWGPDTASEPEVLASEHHDAVREVVSANLSVDRFHDVSVPTCPEGGEATGCRVRVPVPEENQCPARQVARELTAEEQRAAAQDERCQHSPGFTSLHLASAVVDDGELLPVLTRASAEEVAAARAVLADGGVVVTDPRKVRDGTVTVSVIDDETERPGGDGRSLTAPGYALTTAEGAEMAFLSPATLERSGLDERVVATLAHTSAAPDQTQRDALRAALRELNPNLNLYIERGTPTDANPLLLVLAAAAGVVTLGAAGIATGLAGADRRPDLSTLAAVGASPRLRRLLSLSQSGVVAGLGTALGAVAGTGAAFAVLFALNRRGATSWPSPDPYPLEMPWAALGVLLAVPVVAMLGAGLLTRSRLPIERRRLG